MDPGSTAFTTEQVMRLTGITRRRLNYWIDHGLLKPDIDRGKGRGRVRLFSFPNLLEVRVAVWLRDKISLQLMRKVVDKLRERGLEAPLRSITFGVVEYAMKRGGLAYEVITQMADGRWESWEQPGQLIMELTVPIEEFAESLQMKVAEDRRKRRKVGEIEKRRGVLGSAPVIAGTRVPTRAIWSLHKAGYEVQEIVGTYPGLDVADVEAALRLEERRRARRSRSA